MNDVQSLMTAAAMLVMGGFGLFMYKSDEHEEDMIRDTQVEKQEIQEKTDEVAFENPLLKKVEENGGLRGQGPRGEQNFVPFFQKGGIQKVSHLCGLWPVYAFRYFSHLVIFYTFVKGRFHGFIDCDLLGNLFDYFGVTFITVVPRPTKGFYP